MGENVDNSADTNSDQLGVAASGGLNSSKDDNEDALLKNETPKPGMVICFLLHFNFICMYS